MKEIKFGTKIVVIPRIKRRGWGPILNDVYIIRAHSQSRIDGIIVDFEGNYWWDDEVIGRVPAQQVLE